jgi:hypothetical protein
MVLLTADSSDAGCQTAVVSSLGFPGSDNFGDLNAHFGSVMCEVAS